MASLTRGLWPAVRMAAHSRLSNRKRGFVVERKIAFGDDPRQHILFLYDNHSETPRKNLMFFVHGGAWTLGSPENFKFIGKFFARLGFPTIMAGYRLAPRVKLNDQMNDVRASLETGIKAAEEHGFKNRDVIVSGQSAGGHLGSLLVFNRDFQAKNHIDQNMFSGLVLISAPLDFAGWENRRLRDFFDSLITEAGWEEDNPIRHIKGDENIPVICFHGDRDSVVPFHDSESFVDRINTRQPGLAQLVRSTGLRHSDVMSMFFRPRYETDALQRWLDSVDKAGL
jgi:acetyl esterase/lipase